MLYILLLLYLLIILWVRSAQGSRHYSSSLFSLYSELIPYYLYFSIHDIVKSIFGGREKSLLPYRISHTYTLLEIYTLFPI